MVNGQVKGGQQVTHGDLKREQWRETVEHQNARSKYCEVILGRTEYLNMASVQLTHLTDACDFCVFFHVTFMLHLVAPQIHDSVVIIFSELSIILQSY